MKIEIFWSKAQRAELIGSGHILLRDLIAADHRMTEGSKTAVISNICHIQSVKDKSVRIGTVGYKLRMRKSLSEAMRWYREK